VLLSSAKVFVISIVERGGELSSRPPDSRRT